ncbi:amino acid permease [Actinomadura sp. DC4]|uniref:APC family permease n=1 Tax=Actinomadura sp. DC4 TaxID=3055069 RepID=UPI0025B0C026|nr:amino acid permease [Actinomadura sp. DC4]MDN3357379.1 amino acid permease [Actinomadura sp. DC4]
MADAYREIAAEAPPPDDSGENSDTDRLRGHVRLPGAIALAVTIVVGSGALVLPGLAYQKVDDAALLTWAAAAIFTVPLLLIFAKLGSTYPSAGGVAGFVQAAFGRHLAAAVEVLLLGTFGLGIPGIALTGGNYLVALPGLGALPAQAGAALLIVLAGGVVVLGVRMSTRVQVAFAIVLTVALLAVGVLATASGAAVHHLPALRIDTVSDGVKATGVVFFAFTGWEMLSFTTEEYANPRRDFPRAVVLSFALVVVMYLLLAWGVQTRLPRDATTELASPVQALVATFSPAAAHLVAALGVVIIAANLVGAIWGGSRLVMSSAREGLLPAPLARLSPSGNPHRAVIACVTGFLLVIGANAVKLASLTGLLTIAGQNFFLLYLLCAIAYTRLFRAGRRAYGIAVTVVLGVIAVSAFGAAQFAYAAALTVIGVAASVSRTSRRGVSSAS